MLVKPKYKDFILYSVKNNILSVTDTPSIDYPILLNFDKTNKPFKKQNSKIVQLNGRNISYALSLLL